MEEIEVKSLMPLISVFKSIFNEELPVSINIEVYSLICKACTLVYQSSSELSELIVSIFVSISLSRINCQKYFLLSFVSTAFKISKTQQKIDKMLMLLHKL
jgi:hypothetical protein